MSNNTCPFKEGDLVGYKSCLEDPEFSHVGRVREVYLDGIPSHRRPMIKIEGKAGVLDTDHCTKIPADAQPGKRLMDALGALAIPETNFDWLPAGPERDELNAAYKEALAVEVKTP